MQQVLRSPTGAAAGMRMAPSRCGALKARALPAAGLGPAPKLQTARWLANRASSSRVTGLRVQASYGEQWSTPKDAYLTLGLAHCFEKTDEGKLIDRFQIEPVTANGVECMAAGAKTSFKHLYSMTLGDALARNKAAFPAEFEEGIFCEGYEARCDACARTWMRPHAMDNLLDIVPLGQLKSKWNYSTTDKRVLNVENVVNDDDNIKQDMSIDVYGRKEDGDDEGAAPAAAAPAPAAAKDEEEEDELDALLA